MGGMDMVSTTSGGFKGSTYMDTPNPTTSPPHLPSTYTALLCLALLRAPLDRLNIPGLLYFLNSCQAEDGSFSPLPAEPYLLEGFQSDARMAYIASVISHIIHDSSGINLCKLKEWIRKCRTWEGGYASRPGVIEAQGGTTYCSLAALSFMSDFDNSPSPLNDRIFQTDTLRWLVSRQLGGFQGRPGKLEDVCYSFWCGGALSVLGRDDLIDHDANKAFLLSAQSPLGGFGKEPEDYPDPYHSYLALAALSLSLNRFGEDKENSFGLKTLDVRWNVSAETAEWLQKEITRVKEQE
ncbi:geranylgeranyl transferase type-1 subunit beta [Cryptococcus neoformans]|nr:geranylgeranyl transferase type-1 subunit beta [Cryptococcus neoformans var. grubii]OXC62793.1 geranylgeranyl transferase type-1 subunit beta [Cryptococcus neoformans var. grubii MW-RSA852]